MDGRIISRGGRMEFLPEEHPDGALSRRDGALSRRDGALSRRDGNYWLVCIFFKK